MALLPCPECGKETSTTARACPHCGARRKRPFNGNRAAVVAVATIVLAIVAIRWWGEQQRAASIERYNRVMNSSPTGR